MPNPMSGNGPELEWFKSSYSTNDGPDCVEVAVTGEAIRIRDSKNHRSPHLAFAASEWAAFVSYAADH
ncbi:DUF397 domain-containing protein [Streptomyces galilaeus]|nr:DUF397 domain-containing protein [Streptomyces galilaeus]GGW25238.1 hypothetical protein GCM10010350_04880 [Streptomyces galilaeus]